MDSNDQLLRKRFEELYDRAQSYGCAVYSDFLTLDEQSVLKEIYRDAVLVGGYETAERRIARFGDSYGAEDPLNWIKIAPKSQKFADKLTHRDFLGTLIGLGLKRSVLGDIIIYENCGYLCCIDSVTDFIISTLDRVKHTTVECTLIDVPPTESVQLPDKVSVVVSSERLDALVAEVFDLSRSESRKYFDRELVFVNGRCASKPEREAEIGSIVSVRGLGRFIYEGPDRITPKGRMRVFIRRFR